MCGDAAHMAREVNAELGRILASQRGLAEDQGHELVKRLRSSNLYQVGSCIVFAEFRLLTSLLQEDVWS